MALPLLKGICREVDGEHQGEWVDKWLGSSNWNCCKIENKDVLTCSSNKVYEWSCCKERGIDTPCAHPAARGAVTRAKRAAEAAAAATKAAATAAAAAAVAVASAAYEKCIANGGTKEEAARELLIFNVSHHCWQYFSFPIFFLFPRRVLNWSTHSNLWSRSLSPLPCLFLVLC